MELFYIHKTGNPNIEPQNIIILVMGTSKKVHLIFGKTPNVFSSSL